MKRGLVWMLALGLVVAIGSLRLGDPELRPAPGREVVLLSAAWCGICAEARRFLQRGGVEFAEYDVERTERGRALYAQLGGGGVPIVLIDGVVLRGLDRAEWAEALNAPASVAGCEGARC
jgi:glutaredoxin